MIRNILAATFFIGASTLAFANSDISLFSGTYKYGSTTFTFKAAPNKEWGGYKANFGKGDSFFHDSYSFRNSRFEYHFYNRYLVYEGIGRCVIHKNILRYEAVINDGDDPAFIIKGFIKRVPSGLIKVEDTFDLNGVQISESRVVFFRQ